VKTHQAPVGGLRFALDRQPFPALIQVSRHDLARLLNWLDDQEVAAFASAPLSSVTGSPAASSPHSAGRISPGACKSVGGFVSGEARAEHGERL
jgi:hypothetical protein